MSTESLVLPSLHRGEVLLTPEDAMKLNKDLEKSNYRFEVIFEVYNPPKIPPKKPKSVELHLRSKSHSLGDEYTPSRSTKKRIISKQESSLRFDSFGNNSGEYFEKRSSRPRKQTFSFTDDLYDEPSNFAYSEPYKPEKSKPNKTSSQKSSQKDNKPVKILYRTVPISTKHLPKLPKNTWEYSCYRILQMIKYMDTDKWFWYPVDPVVDGVPDYLTVIKRPMDFHTITERLHTKHYSSPYGWQTDMRQIFYNAFLFYPPENIICQAARTLSLALENKLKSSRYINPDEFYLTLSMDPAKLREEIENLYAPRSRKAYDAWVAPVQTLEDRRSKKRFGRLGRLDEDNYTDLDSIDTSGDFTDDDEYVNLNSKYSKKKTIRPDRGLRQDRSRAESGMRRRKPAKFGATMFGSEEIPQYGLVPQPPTIQKMLNDKPLTLSQQKTLQANMFRLAPNQRKAALELVQDELGILADNHKDDPQFFFDTDLLSIERQKQFFTYVNQMAKTNVEHMIKSDKAKVAKQASDVRIMSRPEKFRTPSGMFSDSSSTSSISDVASNLLSSDDFFSSSDSENEIVPEKPVRTDSQKDTGLPEYLPVDEFEGDKHHLSEGIMGNHADFLGKIETPSESDNMSTSGKKTAWMDWKGQAIHHRDVAQQTGVPPRNEDEQIAESFDARI
ncbi:Bromodomain protein [Theileria parva strain Muguga]|uniref:Bromodomain protein n=1 Tax=Theileria parva strain Muguga TaxID=333668 RepID=UPI001C61B3BC|nr:Bromodomain protein [Theileria parva strain Muguga]EAN33453.2 Bromodomain protein [Theileria parva strain Muguga]